MPEILPVDEEKTLLYDRIVTVVSQVAQYALNPALTVRDDLEPITAMILTGVLRNLRVLSARQLAVLLADEADRRAGFVIHEPPHYFEGETVNG